MNQAGDNLDPELIEQMRRKLEDEKAEIIDQTKPQWEEIGTDEDDSAMEVEAYDTEVAMSLEAKEKLKKIDEALERITSGVYGKCEKCGKAIDQERLEAEPDAVTCVGCGL